VFCRSIVTRQLSDPEGRKMILLIPYLLTGRRILRSEQLIGRAFEHDLAALRAASRAQQATDIRHELHKQGSI
jgi:hypothetical protein